MKYGKIYLCLFVPGFNIKSIYYTNSNFFIIYYRVNYVRRMNYYFKNSLKPAKNQGKDTLEIVYVAVIDHIL